MTRMTAATASQRVRGRNAGLGSTGLEAAGRGPALGRFRVGLRSLPGTP